MNPKAINNKFAERNPEWTILPKIEDASGPVTLEIQRRHARGAEIDAACDCTIARAARADKDVVDSMVRLTYAYLLVVVDQAGRKARIRKYQLTAGARSVVDANDKGAAVFGMALTLVPPCASRRAYTQTVAQKAALPGERKQSKATVTKRVKSRQRSAGRRLLSNA